MKIRSGNNYPQDVIYENDVKGEGMALFLSDENPESPVRWFMTVFVKTTQGWFQLGFLTGNTPATDHAPARAVLFASCPGAKGWKVVFQNDQQTSNQGFDTEATIVAGLCCGGGSPYGVFAPPTPGTGKIKVDDGGGGAT